ncbi:hypothetical protein SteCoe_4446 [Stentor coeruleus]|uniref:Uncharacterized protein n=1 Tax=Stentor coeruleus TaxID=5963 RepID=A0A1R2CUM7_9CILI|nr:hypothetical protein SteCoe_4446 [Stentor coeruleus]
MVIYTRKNIQTCDILQSPDEKLRRGFIESSKSIGRFFTNSQETTAHILHTEPLFIGTFSQYDFGEFHPEIPEMYSKHSKCIKKGRHEQSGYTIYECESIPGASQILEVAYPKIKVNTTQVSIGYSSGQKVVDTEGNLPGSIITEIGTNQVYGLISQNGQKHSVEEFKDLYNDTVWPIAKLYSRRIRSHYFTYFREYEVKNYLEFSGAKGTRHRHIEGDAYWSLWRAKNWNRIKSFFGFTAQ